VTTSLAASVGPPLNLPGLSRVTSAARGVADHAARAHALLSPGAQSRSHAIVLAAANLAASGNSGPFNVSGISTVLGSFLGLALLVVGLLATFRAAGQQAHRHAMTMAAVSMLGLLIAGISFAGLTSGLAQELAKLAVHK
jgi:hypothetical protein